MIIIRLYMLIPVLIKEDKWLIKLVNFWKSNNNNKSIKSVLFEIILIMDKYL